ncbi:hypothetical protein BJ508DRAFT_328768 [Ascobolus immersus RN42]|uniref:PiggyBac transposable element-derived protein domain-containing protein n=1 Tax=Ascobolus immersus RN42 TaxID=1160509 RepID=A0A3N4I308_ASCIM|nr:hypothetical protein BJ508DRAFT_328768 [Ascobolus immersus RN42]
MLTELGIGACGTTRPGYKFWPDVWKKVKTNAKQTLFALGNFGGIMAKAVGPLKNVLAFVWVDSNIVQGLTTIHDFLIGDYLTVERRRPKGQSSVQKEAQKAYGPGPDAGRRVVMVPRATHEYNFHMNGVDLTDQYVSYHRIQLITQRNWFPLMYGVVDIGMVNAYLLAKTALRPHDASKLNHADFRLDVAEALIKRGYEGIHSFSILVSDMTMDLNARQDASMTASLFEIRVISAQADMLAGKFGPVASNASQKVKRVYLNGRELSEKGLPSIRFTVGKHIATMTRESRLQCLLCRYEQRAAQSHGDHSNSAC